MVEYNFYQYISYVLSLRRDTLKEEIKNYEVLGMLSAAAYCEEELKELEQAYEVSCFRMVAARQ